MLRTLLVVGLAALLAACEAEPDIPPAPVIVTPEAVERYRTGVTVAMQDADGAIAALEAAAAGADSVGAVAYRETLDALRHERQAIQADLGALAALSADAFEEATDTLDARMDELDEQIGNAPVALARDAAQLRLAAQTRLAALDAETAAVHASADAQALAALQPRRTQIETELARLGAPEVTFTEVRANVVRLFDDLFDGLDGLHPRARAAAAPAAAPAAE